MLINHFEYYYSIDILIYTIYVNGTQKKSTKKNSARNKNYLTFL